MLPSLLNIKVNGTLSCSITSTAQGLGITRSDVEGDIDLGKNNLAQLPFGFGEVTGDLLLDNNQLSGLGGAPHGSGGVFIAAPISWIPWRVVRSWWGVTFVVTATG